MQSVWKVWNAIFNSAGETNQALQARNVIVFQDYLSRVCENRRVCHPAGWAHQRSASVQGLRSPTVISGGGITIFPFCSVICQVLHLHKQWMEAGKLAYEDNVVLFAVLSSCRNDAFLSQDDPPKRKYCPYSLNHRGETQEILFWDITLEVRLKLPNLSY